MRDVRFALVGLGNIGRNLLDVLWHRQDKVQQEYGLRFVLVGCADSGGAALAPGGLDIAAIRDAKLARRSVGTYAAIGVPGATALDMLRASEPELWVDASPTNLRDGQPGLGCMRAALRAGMHVVSANKGPLVLAYRELTDLARENGCRLLYSGTVAGGLPTVNIGVRDLAGSGVTRVEGVFNGTTNYILTRMEKEGISYAEALRGAQDAGIAEPDPTLDVDGWDAANKLVIIANAVLRQPTALADVTVEGIRGISLAEMRRARDQGKVVKLLAVAARTETGYALSVRPTALDVDHPLGRIGLWDMGVVYTTDFMGVISAVIEEKGPVPTSAAVLRDMINVYAGV